MLSIFLSFFENFTRESLLAKLAMFFLNELLDLKLILLSLSIVSSVFVPSITVVSILFFTRGDFILCLSSILGSIKSPDIKRVLAGTSFSIFSKNEASTYVFRILRYDCQSTLPNPSL